MKNQWMEMLVLNNLSLTRNSEFIEKTYDYVIGDKNKSLGYIDFILEDKSHYPPASTAINYINDKPFVDRDGDFLIGNSGGILFKWDFVFVNTEEFSPAALHFEKYGRYTNTVKGSIEYKIFWATELQRRRKGFTRNCKLLVKDIVEYYNPKTTEDRKKELLKPIRIPGEFYTYLNYSRIERTPNEAEAEALRKEGMTRVKTVEAFPRFWDGDYWAFKVDEFAVDNEANNITAKSRRKGYSYKKGSKTANTLNLIPKSTVINVADDIAYLTDSGALTYMVKVNLDWLENKTYWKRGYLKETLDNLELGYKKKSESNKPFGHRSKLLSYSINRNTSVAIGKKAIEINIEEAGKCPNMKQFIEVTLSNMESGAIQIGTFNIWGTGGTKGANWEDFERIFRNPRDIKALEFENIWDFDKRHETCGFFHPQVLNLEPYVVDGNTLHFEAFRYDYKDKAKVKIDKPNDDFIIYCAQRANTPSEAFINTTENLFASPELNKFVTDVRIDSKYHGYTDGWYLDTAQGVKFYDKHKCITERVFNGKFHEFIVDVPHRNTTDIHGCVREFLVPFRNREGNIPDDLYFITVDPYGVNKKQSEITDKHSLYSIQVWMRDNALTPYRGKRLVAEYVGRLNTMKDNDKLLLLFCKRWNAKALVETNRGETISNFKAWKERGRLLTNPTAYIDSSVITNEDLSNYGMSIGGAEVKYTGLTLLKDFIYEVLDLSDDGEFIRLYEIHSLPFLLELQRYNSTGNFDRISTAILAMYEFKKDEFKKRTGLFKTSTTKNKKLYNKLTRN